MNRPVPGRRPLAAMVGLAVVVLALPATARPPQHDGAQAAVPPVHSHSATGAVRPGELLVKTADGRTPAADRVLAAAGARRSGRSRGGLTLVKVTPGRERAAAARLAADPSVEYVEPNYVRGAASHAPSEIGWAVNALRAPQVWGTTPGSTGAGVRVAVLDSGVDETHPQLRGRVVPGLDVYEGSGRDECGHGTAVAGVVGAAHDGVSTVGVAPDVTIVPVKVLRYDEFFQTCVGDDAAIIRGIMWAADPAGGAADIINLSLSGPQPSQALADAVEFAAAQGVLIVAASGNGGDRIPNYPAAYPQVVSVGGLQRDAGGPQWWTRSTFGSVDVAAPAKAVPVLLADKVPGSRVGQPCPLADAQALCADGTSFAAPHVAGLAALLRQQHPELATFAPAARVARLRQWILGTAVDVVGSSDQIGVDMKTGHGRPDAVAASEVSDDPSAQLVTWEVADRVISPSDRMIAAPATLPATLTVTTGTGQPVVGRAVVFTPAPGGSVSTSREVTDQRGRANTVFRSSAAGRRTSLLATVGGQSLVLEAYVLQHDDNLPGVKPPPSPYRGSLDVVYDIDDVFRMSLRAGETVNARLSEVDQQREFLDMYLHNSDAGDVTNPRRAPLREDTVSLESNPMRMRRTVRTDGVRYLDVFGNGSYRMEWWINSPGKVRSAAARPAAFSPNGDGNRDSTLISWRMARPGEATLRIRNTAGTVVRAARFGTLSQGEKAFRWNGRSSTGTRLGSGVYRATVHWANGRGRISSTSTSLELRR